MKKITKNSEIPIFSEPDYLPLLRQRLVSPRRAATCSSKTVFLNFYKLVVFFMLVFPFLSHAYIDPGTGGMIVAGFGPWIIGLLGIIAAFLLRYAKRIFKFFKGGDGDDESKKRKRRFWRLLILATIIIVVGGLAFSSDFLDNSNMNTGDKIKKVLVIGIDGFGFDVAQKMMADGKLPNFNKLAQDGSFLKLNTSNPPNSPVAWTSIATGVNPGKHNIFDFIRRDVGTYLPKLSLAEPKNSISGTSYESYVKAEPFWKILSRPAGQGESGLSTTVIRWPVSFPPEKINGNLLAGLGVPDVKGFLGGYSLYTEKNFKSEKEVNKVIRLAPLGGGVSKNNLIETNVFGPRTMKGGELVEVKVPMIIKLANNESGIRNNEKAEVEIQGKTYALKQGEWSEWIRANFKIGLFKEVSGIFKAHLASVSPFEMYVTAIQIDPADPLVDISYPKSFSRELAIAVSEVSSASRSPSEGGYYTLGIPEETDALVDGAIDDETFLKQIDEIEGEREKMFWSEFEKFKKEDRGIFATVFDSSDRLQHTHWDSGNSGRRVPCLGTRCPELILDKNIIAYYEKKDAFLGKVLEQIEATHSTSSGQVAVFIVSDHGFVPFKRAVNLNNWLLENGFLALKNSAKISADDGDLFKYVDWSKTQAYALGFNSVYVNLKGRESEGIVAQEDVSVLKEKIINGLEAFRDDASRTWDASSQVEESGKPILKVYKKEDIWKGEFLADAPDIIVGYNSGYRASWRTAVGGFRKEIIENNDKIWNGDHLVDPSLVPGVLFSNLRFNKKESANQTDFAPTIFGLLGIEGKNFDGENLMGK